MLYVKTPTLVYKTSDVISAPGLVNAKVASVCSQG